MRRSARVPSVSPISASSAAAPTAVPTISTALGGELRSSDERPAPMAGVPRGWAGCRSREEGRGVLRAGRWRGRDALPVAVALGLDAAGLRDDCLAGAERLGEAEPVFGLDAAPPCGEAGRLVLRR